jgi:hypothetical protein
VCPVNGRITNVIASLDLEGNPPAMQAGFADSPSALAASNSTFNAASGQLVVVPNAGYSGPVRFFAAVSQNGFASYDIQSYTFGAGDTVIFGLGTNFTALAQVPFADRVVAIFTNGIPNSPVGSFTALINWGDNATNSGVIVTNVAGWKEVRGGHTYTNAGDYPVYIAIQSSLGANATVVSSAAVPPILDAALSGTNRVLRWPAWAADYALQSTTNIAAGTWAGAANLPALVGYDVFVTNPAAADRVFFRLKR